MGGREQKKGAKAEEFLRSYFLELGYFVLRGPQVMFEGQSVTDIDLWLYSRPSPLSRERVNVDAKYRNKNARALERILWAKGLQQSLRLERCIVATTDKKDVVKEFGRLNGVTVLDGQFWSRLRTRESLLGFRLSEEDFCSLVSSEQREGNWVKRLENAKSRLVTHIDFDAANHSLIELQYFMEQTVIHKSEVSCRLVYLLTAYFLVSLDYAYRRFAFEEQNVRRKIIAEGLRHGTLGKQRTEEAVKLAEQMIKVQNRAHKASQLKLDIFNSIETLPVDSLAEYFARPKMANSLLANAIEIERIAYNPSFQGVSSLPIHLQSILGLVLDSYSIERSDFFGMGAIEYQGTSEKRAPKPSSNSSESSMEDPDGP